MEVNNDKFGKAIHDPLRIANQVQDIIDEMSPFMETLLKMYGQLQVAKRDLELHKQNMMDSIKIEEVKDEDKESSVDNRS